MKLKFTLNEELIEIEECPNKILLDFLRDIKLLTGAKSACREGECGACAVLIDNKLINSCLVYMGNIQNKSIITIEGFEKTERFKLLQEAFLECGAVQCGFCTPGMILACEALLSQNKNPTEDEIREALSGNLCRCTGYTTIINAVKYAISKGASLWTP